MTIEKNFSLKNYNTFGIDICADFFVSVSSITELQEAIKFKNKHNLPLMVLGGGSNVLFSNPFKGLVIHINLKGKEIIKKFDDKVWVSVQAGENWHEFVLWAVQNDFGGIENLSLIPGNVGTGPIQNIGAYGMEVKDSLVSVKYFDIETEQEIEISNANCQFGYRESIFKNSLKGKFIITEVVYVLTTKNHQLKLAYGQINQELEKQGVTKPTLKEISQTVTKIRESKLPNPEKQGNAGSFFKNPTISDKQLIELKKSFPDIISFPDKNGVKLAAGWLIEKAGWKGKQIGNAGVHAQQALVLINLANAKGSEIVELSELIKKDVFSKFNIKLETEVNVV